MFWKKDRHKSHKTLEAKDTPLDPKRLLIKPLELIENDCGIALLDSDKNILWFNETLRKLFSFSYPDDIGRNISHLIRSPKFNNCFLSQRQGEFCVISDIVLNRFTSITIMPYGAEHFTVLAYDSSKQERVKTAAQETISNLSHELRSPLTVIKGYLEILQSLDIAKTGDPQTLQAIANMDSQCSRMIQMVESSLFLSRLETSVINEDDLEEIDMEKLVTEVITDTKHLHPTLRIETHICKDKLFCIPSDIYSLVFNLLSNAIKYSDDGSIIRIRWHRTSDEWSFEVTDRGIGIKPHLIPYLTERFYRVDKTRTGATGGSGLGLAIVNQILVRYNAKLKVKSMPEKGSSFSCVFPEERIHAQAGIHA